MTGYHQSGTRRDVCVLLYDAGELRGQRLKTALERHYERGIDPKRFYGVLDQLVRAGHVEKRPEGLHDVYSLSDEGEAALLSHFAWLRARLAGAQTADS